MSIVTPLAVGVGAEETAGAGVTLAAALSGGSGDAGSLGTLMPA